MAHMQFVKQLNELEKLNLPRDEFAICGSGPLAVREIRDSHDIDIVVKKKLWKQLAKKYPVHQSGDKRNLIQIRDVEMAEDWFPLLENADKLIETADVINGFRFVKLDYVMEWKKIMNREKDQIDIKLIEKYFKKGKKWSL